MNDRSVALSRRNIAGFSILMFALLWAPSLDAATVAVSGFTFNPGSVTIAQGDSVTWTGLLAGAHNVVEVSQATWNVNGSTPLPGGFSSGAPGTVNTFNFTFTGGMYPPGTYYYVCQPHAGIAMKGIVNVVAPAATVSTAALTFTPATATINEGETVLWTSLLAGAHNVVQVSQATWNANGATPLPGGFNSGAPGSVNTFSWTFNAPTHGSGIYYYVCQPHAGVAMKGTVIVKAASVSTLGLSFTPASVTIYENEVVGWNSLLAGGHNVVEVSQATWNVNGTTPLAGGFSSGAPGTVDTFNFQFTGAMYPPGSYYYVCQPHAGSLMKGEVIVLPIPDWNVGTVGLTFDPASITIYEGDTIQWTDLLAASHNVVEVSQATWNVNGTTPLPGGFNSGAPGTVDTFDFTFAGAMYPPGTYYYICQPHAGSAMKGEVIVLPLPDTTVSTVGLTFTPATITITVGDTVQWTNLLAGVHNVVEVSQSTWNANGSTPLAGGFNSGGAGTVDTFDFTFTAPTHGPGTYYYVCQPHAGSAMKGRVIVNPAPDVTVTTSGLTFVSSSITITEGETVLWTDLLAGGHNVVEVSFATWSANGTTPLAGGFSSGAAGTVDTFSFSFVGPTHGPGIYYYVCQPHAASQMKGQVIVLAVNAANDWALYD